MAVKRLHAPDLSQPGRGILQETMLSLIDVMSDDPLETWWLSVLADAGTCASISIGFALCWPLPLSGVKA